MQEANVTCFSRTDGASQVELSSNSKGALGILLAFVSLVFFVFSSQLYPWKAQDHLSAELRRLRSLSVRRVEWTLENCQRPQRAKHVLNTF